MAVSLGLYMGASQGFRLVHGHVHLNLLGWVCTALIGLTWAVLLDLSPPRLVLVHYGLHNFGLTVSMGGIAIAKLSDSKPFAAIADESLTVATAVLILAFKVLLHPLGTKA